MLFDWRTASAAKHAFRATLRFRPRYFPKEDVQNQLYGLKRYAYHLQGGCLFTDLSSTIAHFIGGIAQASESLNPPATESKGIPSSARELHPSSAKPYSGGNQANEASLYSFPHIFQLPGLHSSELSGLVKINGLDMEWGHGTNINATFKLIRDGASAAKRPPDQMLGTLFSFSDMQFDTATTPKPLRNQDSAAVLQDCNTTFHQVEEFAKQGYKLPKVVWWNLRGPGIGEHASVLVICIEDGTALVSGFSRQLLKLFMGGINDLESYNPFHVMKEAIAAEKYNGWRVVD